MGLLAKTDNLVEDLLKENAKLKKQIAILQDKYFENVAQEYARAFFKKFFAERICYQSFSRKLARTVGMSIQLLKKMK